MYTKTQLLNFLKATFKNIPAAKIEKKVDEIKSQSFYDDKDLGWICKSLRKEKYPYPDPENEREQDIYETNNGQISLETLYAKISGKTEGKYFTEGELAELLNKPKWRSFRAGKDVFNITILSQIDAIIADLEETK